MSEKLESETPSDAATCSACQRLERELDRQRTEIIKIAAGLLNAFDLPPTDPSDWSFHPDTPPYDRMIVLEWARAAHSKCRKAARDLKDVIDPLPIPKWMKAIRYAKSPVRINGGRVKNYVPRGWEIKQAAADKSIKPEVVESGKSLDDLADNWERAGFVDVATVLRNLRQNILDHAPR